MPWERGFHALNRLIYRSNLQSHAHAVGLGQDRLPVRSYEVWSTDGPLRLSGARGRGGSMSALSTVLLDPDAGHAEFGAGVDGASSAAEGSASSAAAEQTGSDGVLIHASVLWTIRFCVNGPKWISPLWWDFACVIPFVAGAWTALNFYGTYIPGMRFVSGFCFFVALLPVTWVVVCRRLRNQIHEGEGGFVTERLQQKVSRDAAKKVRRSMCIMWTAQVIVCIFASVQNATIALMATGLRPDLVLALTIFAFGFPLGSMRFIGMLATVVACAYSISDEVQKVERQCARHHEILCREVLPRAAPPTGSSPSQLAVETERVLSAGRELGVVLSSAHRCVHDCIARSHWQSVR